jgi:hypothetical protein
MKQLSETNRRVQIMTGAVFLKEASNYIDIFKERTFYIDTIMFMAIIQASYLV